MESKNLLKCLVVLTLGVFVNSSVIKVENSTRPTPQKSSFVEFGCSSCFSSENKVCVDGDCYCEPSYNYQYDIYTRTYTCAFKFCSDDFDCEQLQDWNRQCSNGWCVCDNSYEEDYNNGRKCTYSVSVWAWVWVFFLIPSVAVAICLCVRRRRMHLAHTHLVHCPVEQPPLYVTGHQQVVTVRY